MHPHRHRHRQRHRRKRDNVYPICRVLSKSTLLKMLLRHGWLDNTLHMGWTLSRLCGCLCLDQHIDDMPCCLRHPHKRDNVHRFLRHVYPECWSRHRHPHKRDNVHRRLRHVVLISIFQMSMSWAKRHGLLEICRVLRCDMQSAVKHSEVVLQHGECCQTLSNVHPICRVLSQLSKSSMSKYSDM